MSYKKYIYIIFLILSLKAFSQSDSRINSIENQLELLKVDHPEFEQKVNVNISHTTLSNLLLAISKVHGINLNVSPQLEEINVINNFSDVNITDLLVFLVKEYDLEIQFTGNIISISKYQPPVQIPAEKEVVAQYDPSLNVLSLDLQNDPLEKVFRKITDVSGKNLVFAPGMENLPLSIYFARVPFDSAMEKLAISNNLEVTQSRDGFFIFNPIETGGERSSANRIISREDNFNYSILDPYKKVLKVDFNNIPAEDIIYTLGDDLNLDIFTASSLTEMGTVTVNAEEISFDNLLNNIFESINAGRSSESLQQEGRLDQNMLRNEFGNNLGSSGNFTYKKEGDLYFFGTEDQLALKQVEVIQMMHRSIEMLSNPSRSNQSRRADRNNFMAANTNYYPGNNQNFNGGNMSPSNNNNYRSSETSSEINTEGIQKIIPDELMAGIDVKIDSELNNFVVSGPAARIERFKSFVQYIDKPVPVILIEVMILEVNKTAIVETGVSFGLGDEAVQTEGRAFPSTDMELGAQTVNRIIGGFDGFGSLNMGKVLPEFYMNIKAMETNGNLKILSTPKLSTLNGHKAHLSSGETTYYAVTSQSFFGSQIPQTSEVTNYYPIDAELALEIMPFVSGDGEITLDINVIQSNFNGERIAEDAPPGMNSREFSSIIRMRDQDVAILGGIEERTKDDSGSGVPVLARVPVIKWLFSERRRQDSKKKLNILIKPTVIY
ncbi:type II and III secretion system protein [Salinimicrobium sp. MT39]|uniref:Type II and III secretion system protein n=1 Tax=Salinimicrobium profundisediminis TaxID=2994553 RepID=A0A9X3I2A5_9FLAO|nr:type II and III secretion system protein [Salinimicrobium profundisediminis]MCX2839434.1 type II and III secretion system protein [Salinimicrobium profundisediminis]